MFWNGWRKWSRTNTLNAPPEHAAVTAIRWREPKGGGLVDHGQLLGL